MKLALPMLLLAAIAGAAEPLPFVEDDYPRALAEARASKRPIFVDAWAPWCHTCRFMRAYVFNDPALAKQAARFVWLSVDTEKEKNAGFLEKFPIRVWPTLLVVDAQEERPVFAWAGSATVPELERLLDDAARAVQAPAGESGAAELARADRLAGLGKQAEAAAAYRRALGRLDPAERARAVESLVTALMLAGDRQGCAQAARELLPTLPRGPAFAVAAQAGLQCAVDAPDGSPWRAAALAILEPAAQGALAIDGLLADDRSGLYETLVDARKAAGDATGARATAAKWLAFLDAEAGRARSVEARTAFDTHIMEAAIAAGDPARAIPALQASERDLSRDYNPPMRLANLYLQAGRLDEAHSAIERARGLVYGPRTIRLLDLAATIEEKRNDRAAAARDLDRAIGLAEKLPVAQHGPERVAALKKRRAALATQH